jgi:hypothetical protein
MSPYYQESVRLGTEFQKNNKNWAGYDVVKYQKLIKDLVVRYDAKTILDYGCGKGLQYREKLPYGQLAENPIPLEDWKTFDEYLGVKVYTYDPCVEEHDQLPDPEIKFDGVICTQVLNSIPDDDMSWVKDLLQQHSAKFCFIGVNFQREAKGKKTMYDPEYFRLPRTRDFFKNHYTNWSGSDLLWWWKDRPYYAAWLDDQLSGQWQDVPAQFEGKYQYIEVNHR